MASDFDELTAKQQHFMRWLLTPESERPDGQDTLEGYARLNKISAGTLRKWKNDSIKFDRVYRKEAYAELASTENIMAMMTLLRQQIMAGTASPSVINNYLDRLEQLRPPPELVEETQSLSDLTDEQLMEMIVRAAELRGWKVERDAGWMSVSNGGGLAVTVTERE